MTTRDDLERWYKQGKGHGHRYMIVVCDTFSWEDYPVYCSAADFGKKTAGYNGPNMQKVMGTYDLKKSLKSQLKI